MICQFCSKQIKSKSGLVTHENSCKLNPNRVDKIRSSLAGAKKGCVTWNAGKTYEEVLGKEKSDALKRKKSENYKPPLLKLTMEQEKNRIDKIRKYAIKTGFGGYVQGSGRGKKGWYKGYWCDSSWELAFVIYNLEHNIEFIRNRKAFSYTHDEKIKKWYPDFIIDNNYYEVKGYMTEQVKAKIESFPHELLLIGKEEMKKYLQYTKEKYGKDFVKLYE